MPVIDLKPAVYASFAAIYGVPVWQAVGGSLTGVLSDNNTASYLQFASSAPALFDDQLWYFGTTTLPANQMVSAVRLRVNFLSYTATAQDEGLYSFYVYSALAKGGSPVGTGDSGFTADSAGHYFPISTTPRGPRMEIIFDPAYPRYDPTVGPSATRPPRLKTAYQFYDTQVTVPGVYYSPWWDVLENGHRFDQTALSNLRLLLTMRGTDGIFYGGALLARWTEVALEVDVRTQPTVQVFSSVGTSLGAVVQWAATMNDGDTQSSWQLAVFQQSVTTLPGFDPNVTTAVYRTAGTGTAQSAFVPGPLTVGSTYVVYVRVAKLIGGVANNGLPNSVSNTNFYSAWSPQVPGSFNTIFITPVDTATYAPQLPNEGVLGCHDWHATIQVRGGGSILVDLPYSSLKWGRSLQEVSQASVTYPRSWLPWVPDIEPWEHELVVWRDSEIGNVVEWVGPVTGMNVDRDTITLRARDWFTLFEHRRIHTDHTLNGIELATIFAAVVIDALSVDNSPNIGIVIHATGTIGDRAILASQYRRAADVLRELGRAGVDWTMVGRTIIAGGRELGIAALRTLLDFHVVSISGDANGESASTDVTVIGKAATQNLPVVANQAIPADPRGVLETMISTGDVQDQLTALLYASSTLALLSGGVPRTFRVAIDDQTQSAYGRLIPGARVPVDLPSMGLFETLRLRSVSVGIDRSPDGQSTEACSLELTSLGDQG